LRARSVGFLPPVSHILARAKPFLSDATRFDDQQLSSFAKAYLAHRVVQLCELKDSLEAQLGPAGVKRITCTLTAETEDDLRLALRALTTGAGAWKLPRTLRRLGRHVQARLTPMRSDHGERSVGLR
jgi:hypothetical protein